MNIYIYIYIYVYITHYNVFNLYLNSNYIYTYQNINFM